MNLLVLPLSLLAFLVLLGPQRASAADPSSKSVVTIEGMHCAGCAKSVARQLQSLPAVAKADVDVQTGLATVTAAKGQEPSPRQLWEAVEAAGYRPTQLRGPSGTFTSKPSR